MIIGPAESDQLERLVVLPPRFELEPPRENPFEAVARASVTDPRCSFDLRWAEEPSLPAVSTPEEILENILARSRMDAERFASSPYAHANYALALMNSGKLKEAAEEFEKVLSISPRHFMTLANLAQIHVLQSEFDEAEGLYKKLSEAYPKESSPLVNLSYVLLRTGRSAEAIEVLGKAVAIDGQAIFPRYLLALCLLAAGDTRGAIGHLRSAARSDVRSPAVHQTLGVAYLTAGDAKGAVRSFKAALALAPNMKGAVHSLANVLLQQGQTDSLVELLIAHLDREPTDLLARQILGEAYFRSGQFKTARLQYTAVLQQLHGDGESERRRKANLQNNIGACFDRQGDSKMATRWIERSIETHPASSPSAYHNLARLRMRRHQFQQAWQVVKECRNEFPEDHETPVVEAGILAEQNRYDDAIDLLHQETSTGKATANSYCILGWILSDMKDDLEGAEKVLSDGLARYPNHLPIINNLAYVLLSHGRPTEARRILSVAAKIKESPSPESTVTLTATKGLLCLWERDIAAGRHLYEQAEDLARASCGVPLCRRVRQKMHLELAKAYLRQNNLTEAKVEVLRGLRVKDGYERYRRELAALSEYLGSTPPEKRPETST